MAQLEPLHRGSTCLLSLHMRSPVVSPSSSLHLDAKPRNTVRILGNWRTGQMGHVRGRVARNCRGCGPTAFAHLRPYARHVGQGPPRTRTRVCVPLRAPTGSTLAPRCTRSAKVCPRPDTRSVTRADPEESGRWCIVRPPVDTPLSKGVQPGSILPEISSASNVREMETYNRPLPICVYCVRIIAQGMCNTGCTIDVRSVFEYAMKRDIFGDRVFFFLLKRERD